MKKDLFLLLFSILVCVPVLVLAQEAKPKLPVSAEANRVAVEMIVVDNKIFVENAPVGKKIEIFSVVGVKVVEIEIKTSSSEYPLNVPKGYYIFKINDIVRKGAIR